MIWVFLIFMILVGMFVAVSLVSIDVTDAYRRGRRDGKEGRPFDPLGKKTPPD